MVEICFAQHFWQFSDLVCKMESSWEDYMPAGVNSDHRLNSALKTTMSSFGCLDNSKKVIWDSQCLICAKLEGSPPSLLRKCFYLAWKKEMPV